MRLKKYSYFLTLVLVFSTFLVFGTQLWAASDSKLTPDPVPVLKRQNKKKEIPKSPPSEDQLPTLQITSPLDSQKPVTRPIENQNEDDKD